MDLEGGNPICYVCLDDVKKYNDGCHHNIHYECKELMIKSGFEKCAICSVPFYSKKKRITFDCFINTFKIVLIIMTFLILLAWITLGIIFAHSIW
jgi:hypothetical protein